MNLRLPSTLLSTCLIAVELNTPALAQTNSAPAQKPGLSWFAPIPVPQQAPSQPTTKPNPVSPPTPVSVSWHRGLTVKVCPDQKSSGTCVTKAMPKQVGKPTRVLTGNFISTKTATASWIVMSKTKASLCYVSRASKTSTTPSTTVCRQIDAPQVGDDVDVVTVVDHGRTYFGYFPKAGAAANRAAIEAAVNPFQKALAVALRKSQTNAAKRYAGTLVRTSRETASGDGGGCYDDEDGSSCESGGDGGGDGGGDDSGGGLGGGSGGASSPPGGITNNDGSMECHFVGIVYVCTATSPPPVAGGDPYDPPLPPPSPASDPDEPGFLCRLFGWLCPEPANPPGPPPYELPTANDVPPPYIRPIYTPDDGRPFAKYRDGYEAELDRCDADRAEGEWRCQLQYTLLGGPILRDKPTLTPSERKQLKEANNEYSACMVKVGDVWGECYRNAQHDYRENNSTSSSTR